MNKKCYQKILIYLTFLTTLFVQFPLYATNYHITVNTTRATTLQLLGGPPDTLLVDPGVILTSNANVTTVSMDGRTTTTNNGTMTNGNVGNVFTIISTTNFLNDFSTITNNGNINQTGSGFAIRTDQAIINNTTYAPFHITNNGIIQSIFLFNNLADRINNPYIINNTATGTIQPGGAVGTVLFGTSAFTSNSLNVTLNNDGTINGDIFTQLGTPGPLTATISNSATGIINGNVNNQGNGDVIYIFNASAQSHLNGDFIGTGGNQNQYNANGGSGTVTLFGNINTINFVNVNSGTFNSNGFNITGFDTYTVANGATVNQAAGTTNGTTLNDSGTYNYSGGVLTLTNNNVLSGGQENISGGTLTATTSNVAGQLTITNGTLNSTNINVNNGGILTNSGTGIITSTTTNVNNGGTFTINSPSTTTITNLNINAGGLFNQNGNITANITNSGLHRIATTGVITIRNVTGNYVQTPNGTFSPDIISTTNYGRLAVTGTTNIQDGTILINLPNGIQNIKSGDTFDVITSGGPLTYNLNTLIIPSNFTVVTSALSANIVRLLFNTNFRFQNTIPSLQPLAIALDQISANPPNQALANLINEIFFLPNQAAFESALAQLEPNVYQAAIIPNLTAQMVLLDKIAHRLDTVRAANTYGRTGYMAGDLAGTCSSIGPIFYSNTLSQEPVDSFPGYTANNYGLGIVADAPVDENIKVGAGVGLAYTIVQPNGLMAGFGNEVKITNLQPLIYGSYDYKPYFLDAMFSLGYNSYNSTRNIIFLDEHATANYSGMQYSYFLRTGLVIPSCWVDLTLPLISYQYAKVKQKPFTEEGGGVANLRIPGQISNYTQFALGGKIALVNYPPGFYMELHGGGLINTNSNRSVVTTASFAEGGPTFFLQGATPSREGYNVGATITLLFKECILFTAGYDYTNFSSLEIQSAWARLRWLF